MQPDLVCRFCKETILKSDSEWMHVDSGKTYGTKRAHRHEDGREGYWYTHQIHKAAPRSHKKDKQPDL